MAAAVQYLQENNIFSYEDLEAKTFEITGRFHTAADKLKQTETAIKRNTALKKAIVDYAKTRPVFEEYKAKKYSRKYLAEHEAEFAVYRAAQASMRELLGGAKLPKMDALKTEWRRLAAKKKSGYADYRAATLRANMARSTGVWGCSPTSKKTRVYIHSHCLPIYSPLYLVLPSAKAVSEYMITTF